MTDENNLKAVTLEEATLVITDTDDGDADILETAFTGTISDGDAIIIDIFSFGLADTRGPDFQRQQRHLQA